MHTDAQLRRLARSAELKLIKYRERSRWYSQYGPYALADGYGNLVAYGLDAEDVVRELRPTG
ncbi:hypothetical protein A5791_19905 [Mycobacterium sp. 852002-51163_SCH5372311]|uniref:hypothetical protein n=1 Tax=Mycobacterium sp. 852002-51163_SCH5372311 TaxID=1834097 RepID=UPI0008008458|nr:hypothetical protein [Mycobacterium sp. 852002-51163_SCH5372311]OBF86961.1 hypothetical protein A5791_19905 [Mycobacterium sp. 852002-51163_SCH5372311]